MSLTPDGFADSVKGNYFIEPEEIKTNIRDFFNYKEKYPNAIPYIQHQNDSLVKEFWDVSLEIQPDQLNFLSKAFFEGKEPDAQNMWIGYD